MPAYEWHFEYACPPGIHKVSAEQAGKVCEELRKSDSGLTPQSLLDYSRDENAPTHNEFEWDDAIAANAHRLDQARKLIMDLRVVHDDDSRAEAKERAFVVTPDRRSEYVPIREALSNAEWRASLLRQARKDGEVFLAKYRRLEELADVNSAIEAFISNAEKAS